MKPQVRRAKVYKDSPPLRGMVRGWRVYTDSIWETTFILRDKGQWRHSWNILNPFSVELEEFSAPPDGSWAGKAPLGSADGTAPWLGCKWEQILTKPGISAFFRPFSLLVVSPAPAASSRNSLVWGFTNTSTGVFKFGQTVLMHLNAHDKPDLRVNLFHKA